MDGWQNIASAPKDGTLIVGANLGPDGSVEWAGSCWWEKEFSSFISTCREMTWAGGDSKLHSPVREVLTHWILPPNGQ